MARTWMCTVACVSFLFAAAASHAAAPAAVSVKQDIDSSFAKFKADFDKLAASPTVKKGVPAQLSHCFFKELEAHQPYYSLLQTNAKGIVTSEVIRLVKEPSKKKQDLSAEPWFKHVSTKLEEYTGYVNLEETGRYYLLWAAPVMAKAAKGKETFAGVVVLKLDIWDSFQKIAHSSPSPFLVRMEHLYLYSHDWHDTVAYSEDALAVPGVQKISVRYPKPAAAIVADTQAAPAVDSAKIAPVKHGGSCNGFLVAIIILLLIILAFYVVKPLAAVREKTFRKREEI